MDVLKLGQKVGLLPDKLEVPQARVSERPAVVIPGIPGEPTLLVLGLDPAEASLDDQALDALVETALSDPEASWLDKLLAVLVTSADDSYGGGF